MIPATGLTFNCERDIVHFQAVTTLVVSPRLIVTSNGELTLLPSKFQPRTRLSRTEVIGVTAIAVEATLDPEPLLAFTEQL